MRTQFEQGTWLDDERLAYNTPTGSASRSNRRAAALCDDGKVRTFRVGIPDTAFTIPAIGSIKGKRVTGYVSVDDDTHTLIFHQYKKAPKLSDKVSCECGKVFGERCQSDEMDLSETVTVEWMPKHLRSSHEAAGNIGTYPANGAIRLRCNPECAERLVEGEDEQWASIVD